MIEYIYIVKCPGCEDEMFNFFTDARMQCDLLMSKKPYITQVEVERNDFGECTDHHDLGTVWSWEEAMKDTEDGYTEAEPAKSIFTKDDLKLMADGKDPEFDELDNSVDCEFETSEVSLDEDLEYEFKPTELQKAKAEVFKLNAMQRFKQDETLPEIFALYKELQPERRTNPNDDTFWEKRMQEDPRAAQDDFLNFYRRFHELRKKRELYVSSYDTEKRDLMTGAAAVKFKSNAAKDKLIAESIYKATERKPIPEGMTIEELVEEMEENEDTVECTWCEDLFDKSECRYEVDLGWLCSRCEMAIKSRGETLTFRENNYWDFLDESAAIKDSPVIGKHVRLVENGADMNLATLKHILKINREYALPRKKIDFIVTFDNDCIIRQETDLGYLITIPCYYRNPVDRSKILEQPEYHLCWISKKYCEIIGLDEDLDPEELHDLGNEYDGGYPAETPEVSDSHLKLCPECGKETFDIETGICVECGFN